MSESELWGFQRKNGEMGIRNYVAVISAMDNSNPVARRVANSVQGAVALTPGFGRAMLGEDYEQHKKTLVGLGTNPNVYGAVIISLEINSAAAIAEGITKTGRPVEIVSIEDAGGTVRATEEAARHAMKMALDACSQKREPMDWSQLVIGVECGGSDGSSGLVSNPATGMVADRVIDRGGTAIMSETLEILGGEHILVARSKDEATGRKLVEAVNFCVSYASEAGVDVLGSNPTPDNIAGGLSTIEEKALGAIKKGGSRTLMEVVGYGQRPTCKGFVVMDAPCPGIENMTAMASAGCHAIVFSTGKGNTSGNPISPTIKVSGNPYTVVNLADNIDVDLSAVIIGEMPLAGAADILEAELKDVCNGKMTKADVLGEVEIAISRIGRCL
ncbi:MAG: UxaA family hydrolase [Desulfocucumaceae bacterium]